MKERDRDHAWRTIVEFGRRRPTSRCRQGAGMSDVGRRKPVGFRPGQEVSCHGMTNTSAINIAKDDVYHARTKHINIYYHWIREQVAKRSIHVEFVSTHDNIADIMTKALPEPKVNLFVDAMRLRA